MNNKKIEYLETLLKKRDEIFDAGPYNLLIHSILNTSDINELIDYYLACPDLKLKQSLESNIFKRVALTTNANELYDRLYQLLQDTNYYQRQRIRKLLVELLPVLDKTYKIEYFYNFYNSKYKYDVSSALSISGDIWDSDMNSLILKDYLNTGNHNCLQTFIEYGTIESLLPYLEKIWALEPKDYLKIKIIKKLSKAHIDKFEFIRDVEPEKYLFAMCTSDNKYDNHTLLDCLNEIADEIKPFGILNLSRLHRWDLIEEEIKNYCD